MDITLLGPGCANRPKTGGVMRRAVEEAGVGKVASLGEARGWASG